MNLRVLILFWLPVLGVWSCAHLPTASYQSLNAAEPTKAPQLLFVSCRMLAGANGTKLEVLHAEAVAGTLKTPPPDADTPDFVRVLQLDSQGQPLTEARVAHPLRRNLEHVADDQRSFQRSEVVLPTAEFFVRMALRPAAVTLRIEEVANGKTTLLTEIPIPSKS